MNREQAFDFLWDRIVASLDSKPHDAAMIQAGLAIVIARFSGVGAKLNGHDVLHAQQRHECAVAS